MDHPSPPALAAARHVRASGLLVLPTDTVYGIGCLASDAGAVARLLAAKGRGRQMPPPVLVAGPEQLDAIVAHVPATARALMEACWPGALTLVLDAAPGLGWDLGETGGTLAVRMPDHPLALALLRQVGPMAVTSANPTGEPPATDAASSRAAFPGRVTDAGALTGADLPAGSGRPLDVGAPTDGAVADILLLDGGPTPGPVPSTIVSLAGRHALAPLVLREGVITRAELADVLNPVLAVAGAAPLAREEGAQE
ncbi:MULTISPECIES: L-threonylcarbamoyladenylate synthase [Actinomyces]|uniref:L-threonylcarbamoyladenylate synthase n=1 Tax=Actinomyces sp. ZJ751 TaxID=2708341 RepID=UPI001F1B7695|nr:MULTISPECIES: L-threonylcarbamoyladenylate synthase [Actinomyces]